MSSPRLALALRHVHFEDCGTLAGVLRERGFEIRYVEAGRENLRDVDITTPELVIGLGGSVSVYTECAKAAFTEWLESVGL